MTHFGLFSLLKAETPFLRCGFFWKREIGLVGEVLTLSL